jgi:hypothetical protein
MAAAQRSRLPVRDPSQEKGLAGHIDEGRQQAAQLLYRRLNRTIHALFLPPSCGPAVLLVFEDHEFGRPVGELEQKPRDIGIAGE